MMPCHFILCTILQSPSLHFRVPNQKPARSTKHLQKKTEKQKSSLFSEDYDDENSDYIVKPGEKWLNRYEIKHLIGKMNTKRKS